MPLVVHSVTKVALTRSRTVTVWRKETGLLKEYEHKDIIGSVIMQTGLTPAKLAEHLINNVPRVVMAEVLESDGTGVRVEKQ